MRFLTEILDVCPGNSLELHKLKNRSKCEQEQDFIGFHRIMAQMPLWGKILKYIPELCTAKKNISSAMCWILLCALKTQWVFSVLFLPQKVYPW